MANHAQAAAEAAGQQEAVQQAAFMAELDDSPSPAAAEQNPAPEAPVQEPSQEAPAQPAATPQQPSQGAPAQEPDQPEPPATEPAAQRGAEETAGAGQGDQPQDETAQLRERVNRLLQLVNQLSGGQPLTAAETGQGGKTPVAPQPSPQQPGQEPAAQAEGRQEPLAANAAPAQTPPAAPVPAPAEYQPVKLFSEDELEEMGLPELNEGLNRLGKHVYDSVIARLDAVRTQAVDQASALVNYQFFMADFFQAYPDLAPVRGFVEHTLGRLGAEVQGQQVPRDQLMQRLAEQTRQLLGLSAPQASPASAQTPAAGQAGGGQPAAPARPAMPGAGGGRGGMRPKVRSGPKTQQELMDELDDDF